MFKYQLYFVFEKGPLRICEERTVDKHSLREYKKFCWNNLRKYSKPVTKKLENQIGKIIKKLIKLIYDIVHSICRVNCVTIQCGIL